MIDDNLLSDEALFIDAIRHFLGDTMGIGIGKSASTMLFAMLRKIIRQNSESAGFLLKMLEHKANISQNTINILCECLGNRGIITCYTIEGRPNWMFYHINRDFFPVIMGDKWRKFIMSYDPQMSFDALIDVVA